MNKDLVKNNKSSNLKEKQIIKDSERKPVASMSRNMNIKLSSFNSKILHNSAVNLVGFLKNKGISYIGPVPLPVKISKTVVNRSPHVDSRSKEVYETRSHSRLVVIHNADTAVVDALNSYENDIPAGVFVEIRLD